MSARSTWHEPRIQRRPGKSAPRSSTRSCAASAPAASRTPRRGPEQRAAPAAPPWRSSPVPGLVQQPAVRNGSRYFCEVPFPSLPGRWIVIVRRLIHGELGDLNATQREGSLKCQAGAGRVTVQGRRAPCFADHSGDVLDLALDGVRGDVAAVAPAAPVVDVDPEPGREQLDKLRLGL